MVSEYARGVEEIVERTGKSGAEIRLAEEWVAGEMLVRKGWGAMSPSRFLRFVELVLSGIDPFTERSE